MNPCNNGSYHGWLLKEPTYIKNKEGVAFQARFVLKVKRDYRNREGKYEYDYIPMRISGESRLKLAANMNPGDSLAVCGSIKTERYETNGQPCFEVYVNVDSVSFSPRTSTFLEKEEEPTVASSFNLPFA